MTWWQLALTIVGVVFAVHMAEWLIGTLTGRCPTCGAPIKTKREP